MWARHWIVVRPNGQVTQIAVLGHHRFFSVRSGQALAVHRASGVGHLFKRARPAVVPTSWSVFSNEGCALVRSRESFMIYKLCEEGLSISPAFERSPEYDERPSVFERIIIENRGCL